MTDNEERFKNFIFFKVPVTDRELGPALLGAFVIVAVLLVVLGIYCFFADCNEKVPSDMLENEQTTEEVVK